MPGSYGFRPNRSAHQAIKQATEYINEGYKVVVDIDLERFFDRVNHDKLMHLVSLKVQCKRVLKLVRRFLESGIMARGMFEISTEGTPQCGPLSPLLSNILLDELDKELERRGHRFCRYTDDCNICFRSKRSAERVMSGISHFIEDELLLKVNKTKSEVGSPKQRKFLRFSFYSKAKSQAGIRIHLKSVQRVKDKVRKLNSRSNAMSMEERIKRLSRLIIGWTSYFGLADMKRHCGELDEWMRRRLRMCHWKDWKKISAKLKNLKNLALIKTRHGSLSIPARVIGGLLVVRYFKERSPTPILRNWNLEHSAKLIYNSVTLRTAHAERHVGWCERTASQLMASFRLDYRNLKEPEYRLFPKLVCRPFQKLYRFPGEMYS